LAWRWYFIYLTILIKITVMKKSMLVLILSLAALYGSAQDTTVKTTTTTTVTHKYVYYPSVNVYFDQATGDYWYQDKDATEWTRTQTLPSTIIVDKTPQFPVESTGTDPWKNNQADIKKYKIKKNGTVKIKTRDN